MKFTYQARTKEGKLETGTIEAYSKDAAAVLLQKYNIFVTDLQEQRSPRILLSKTAFGTKVSKKDLAIFFRQLSVMLESRVPVVQSISSLAVQATKPNFREMLLKIASLVEGGLPLSESFAMYSSTFDSFYINLVKSGEESGKISESLNYISENLERQDDISSQVRQAMIYPGLVVCVLFIVITIIIVEVIPKITDLISQANTTLPPLTLAILTFYTFLEKSWWVFAGSLFLIILFSFYYSGTQEGGKMYHRIALKIPFLGSLLKKIFVARFCGNLATLLGAGIPVSKALKITEDTVDNIVYKEIIIKMGRDVAGGEKISSVMARHQDYFAPFVVQMVKVGEETGKLDKTLNEIVALYQKEVKRSIAVFSTLLEPTLIIFLGVFVAILAVSILSLLYGVIGSI